jgi:hypothetical protein
MVAGFLFYVWGTWEEVQAQSVILPWWFGQDVQFVNVVSKSAGRPVNNSLRDRKT